MIANDLVKEAIVKKLRSYVVTLVSRLPDAEKGIRELFWKGTTFQYPNVRVELESQVDATDGDGCSVAKQDFSIHVFSQKHSSQEADEIAGIIIGHIRGLGFTLNTVKFQKIKILENIPAIQQNENTWRAQIRCRSIIYLV